MRRFFRRASEKAGMPPGSLVLVGEKKIEKPEITIFDYDVERVEEQKPASVDQCIAAKDTPTTTWINVSGIHDIELLEKLGQCYGLHPLVLEDILHTGQRSKVEEYEGYLFIVLKMLQLEPHSGEIVTEQISLVLGPRFVLSFQETPQDVFDPVRTRLHDARSRIRQRGADYLIYALMDAVVDNYFAVLEAISDRIEQLEEELARGFSRETLVAIQTLRRDLISLRKSIWPLREMLARLDRGEFDLIKDPTSVYLRDVYDHTIQVAETIESFRDIVSGMHDTYLSGISNRMNEIMKVLTIFASIFIPLTFVAGIYGMNFEYMPELAWRWAYPIVWLVMVSAGVGMLVYFRRKGWL